MKDISAESEVLVSIFGEKYPIMGAGDASYIARIADIVDSRMKQVASDSGIASRDRVAILAALSIASELYEQSEKVDSMGGEFDTRVDSILLRLDQAIARSS